LGFCWHHGCPDDFHRTKYGEFSHVLSGTSDPLLILAVIPAIEQWIRRDWIQYFAFALCLLSLIPLSTGCQTKFDQNENAYQLLEGKMDTCNQIYGSPLTDLYLLGRNINPVYENGLTEYGYTIIMSRNTIVHKLLGGNDGQLENKWNSWNQMLGDKVIHHSFDCLVVDNGVRQTGGVSIEDYYKKAFEVPDGLDWDVVTYNQQKDITIWIPKE
jgi:hypothetical protein